jgi:transposase-like protein
MKERGAEAATRWRGLVSEQVASGKSVVAFCRERGLPASQLFSWKKRFRQAESAKFVEAAVMPAVENTSKAATVGRAIEVRLRGDRTVIVEPGFDARHLQALLMVLESEA